MADEAFVPGSGNSMTGNAVVVPEYNQQQFARADYLNQLQEQQALQEQKLQQQQKQHQAALQKYQQGLFLNKNFLTGTEYDPHITDSLASAQNTISDAIKADPSMETFEIQNMAANLLAPIQNYSDRVKLINTGLQNLTSGLSQYKGINTKAVQQQALLNMTHDVDPTGKFTLRDPDQISVNPTDQQQAVQDVFMKTPDVVATTPGAMNPSAVLDNMKPNQIAGTFKQGINGRDISRTYSASLLPFQTLKENADGSTFIDNNIGQPVVQVRSQQAPSINGQPGPTIVDNDTYNTFTSHPNGLAYIGKQLQLLNADRKQQGLDPIDPNSTAGDIAAKKIVYDYLSKLPAPKMTTDYATSNDKQWAEQNANWRSTRAYNYKVGQDNAGINAPNLVEQYNIKSGQDVHIPGTTPRTDQIVRIIPANLIDPKDKNIIDPPIKNADGTYDQVGPQVITTTGGHQVSGYIVNSNGDLVGANNQVIDKDGIQSRAIDAYKKETITSQAPVTTRQKNYTLKATGKSYTHDQLINMGYNDAQILQAQSMGTIK